MSAPGSPARVALVPGCLALLPEHASLHDPVAELRAACRAAVAWLAGTGGGVRVLAGASGTRVAEALLSETGARADDGAAAWLVVANGSARRTEKAPGHLDDRAAGFDAALGKALAAPDAQALAATDAALAEELWADVAPLVSAAGALAGAETVAVDYDEAPYGVQYWVARWAQRAQPA